MSKVSRRIDVEVDVALKLKKLLLVFSPIIVATVVLPQPGGPQNIADGISSVSIN